MFNTHLREENGFSIVVLKDEESGCYAEILPQCGALLHSFGVDSPQRKLQLIDHFSSQKDFENQCEELGYLGCKLSPFVCRLKNSSYHFGGINYTVENRSPGNHALHGLLYRKPFQLVTSKADHHSASVTLKYAYRSDDPGYPFDYDCTVTWKLNEDYQLQVTTVIENKSSGLIPVQDGWHPYFDLGKKVDELELELQSGSKLVFDEQLLPTGEKIKDTTFDVIKPIGSIHLDNSFELDLQECQPLCVLRNTEGGFEVGIYPSASYPILQIYTPAHRRSIAIENLSGPPNAFNTGTGFDTLESGQQATYNTAYKIRFL